MESVADIVVVAGFSRMSSTVMVTERRKSSRRAVSRLAKIQIAGGEPPRDCLVTDISEGGVRLHVQGVNVPERFVLLISGDVRSRDCSVVWRIGSELGAQFIDGPDYGSRKPAAVREPAAV